MNGQRKNSIGDAHTGEFYSDEPLEASSPGEE
jgi:hypothetical protein